MSTEEPGDGRRHDVGEVEHHLDVEEILGNVVQAGQIRGGIHFHPRTERDPDGHPVPRQLPAAPRGFVNRVSEVGELDSLTSATAPDEPHPVIVVVGSGGVGKTALALHWAHRVRERFSDGELFVNLRGYDSGQPVPASETLERLLRALGVAAGAIPPELEDRSALFRSLVAGRKLLIVLDNAASASQVRPLIPGGLGPLLLVTSRNRMPSLAVRDGVGYVHADILAEADAIGLIEAVTGTGRTDDSKAEISELVRLCARLPLALRIAAERAVSRPSMDLSELITDLRDASGLWEALSVEDGADAEDVRTVFTWSYRALPESAAWIFRVIGLHPGADISVPALAAAAGVSPRETRRAADILIGAYLIESTAGPRFQMHDLLRAYANAQCEVHDNASGLEAVMERMSCWYAASADSAAEHLAVGSRFVVELPTAVGAEPTTFADTEEAVTWYELEGQNLVAIARLALASGMHTHAFAVAMTASALHLVYFNFDAWDTMSKIALEAANASDRIDRRALAQRNRGTYLLRRGHYRQARKVLEDAQSAYEEIGDRHGAAEAINVLGLVELRLRDLDAAVRHFTEAARVFGDLGDQLWASVARGNLVTAQIELEEYTSALQELPTLVEFFGHTGDSSAQTNALNRLAEAHRRQGNPNAAKQAIEKALEIVEVRRVKVEEGALLLEASRVQLALGEVAEALETAHLAAAIQRQIGDKSRETQALALAADALLCSERIEEAHAFYLQAAEQFRELAEGWNEAQAQLGAADAAARLGRRDAEHDQLERAAFCLEAFDDPRAVAMRQEIQARLE